MYAQRLDPESLRVSQAAGHSHRTAMEHHSKQDHEPGTLEQHLNTRLRRSNTDKKLARNLQIILA